MNGESRVTIHKGVAGVVALALLIAGAGASYLLMRSGADDHSASARVPEAPATGTLASDSHPPAADAPRPEVIVSLTAEAIERAGIVTAPVSTGASGAAIRLPGVVEPNAYRQVTVTSLVAGRVTRVSARLGDRVRRGQTLAEIYSPELAEAQTRYVSGMAMLEAHERELQRTGKLAAIGAASRQEVERIHAEHAAQTAAVQSARAQLELLGVPASTIDTLGSGTSVQAATAVPAPIDGVVTARAANVGLNVDPATVLFTVVDLSTVWIVADGYEKDVSRVRIGHAATIAVATYPGLSLGGRVSYIDPQVNAETRTAKIRVEVPNPRGELRLGAFADVVVEGAATGSAILVPRGAIQNLGDRTVVYVADPGQPGRFTEREVRLGGTTGELVEVSSGVQPGERVVTNGSFFLRAERERLGLRPAASVGAGGPAVGSRNDSGGKTADGVQRARVVVNEQGFEPATVTLRAGMPARITFVRTTDKTCGTEVVFPSLKIERALPLNQPVSIDFRPARTGDIAFACGMTMLKGVVVVE